MLYIIGLGLESGDISLKALEALKDCDKVYAEFYTSPNLFDIDGLEKRSGSDIEILDRENVEQTDKILESSKKEDTAFIVSGDPLTATTHYEIYYQARERDIDVEIIHASSIFTAVAETGLSIYKFGRTTTLADKEGDYLPESPYEIINKNLENGFHTLLLIDPDMDLEGVVEVLKKLENERQDEIFTPGRKVFLISKAGSSDSSICYCDFEDLPYQKEKGTHPPFTIVVPADLSHQEEKFSNQFL